LLDPPAKISASDLMASAGMAPDPWQAAFLEAAPARALLMCSRQSGKTSAGAAAALHQALSHPDSTTLLLSPAQRQSAELLGKVRSLLSTGAPSTPVGAESVLSLRLGNGARVISLPGRETTVRGYTADLIVIDEASRVPNELLEAVRPMLAVSGGRLVALSTPYGRRGWFHDAWTGSEPWHRVKVTAEEVGRIPADFLAEEARSLPASVFAAEYHCEFTDADAAVFSSADVLGALTDEVEPLFGLSS